MAPANLWRGGHGAAAQSSFPVPRESERNMDLNEFIFRDDTAEVLGAEIDSDDFEVVDETAGSGMPAKIGLTAIGGAILGMSHFLGAAAKHL
jgi:hypothetical protein